MTAGLLLLTFASSAEPARPVDFDTEIIPVLTKSGCNAGACHGAAAGRGGFHLSLFGGDPASDHDAIVQELEGRRGLHCAYPGAVEGAGHAPRPVDGLDGVRDRERRNRRAGDPCCRDRPIDQRGRDERAGRVVHDDHRYTTFGGDPLQLHDGFVIRLLAVAAPVA